MAQITDRARSSATYFLGVMVYGAAIGVIIGYEARVWLG